MPSDLTDPAPSLDGRAISAERHLVFEQAEAAFAAAGVHVDETHWQSTVVTIQTGDSRKFAQAAGGSTVQVATPAVYYARYIAETAAFKALALGDGVLVVTSSLVVEGEGAGVNSRCATLPFLDRPHSLTPLSFYCLFTSLRWLIKNLSTASAQSPRGRPPLISRPAVWHVALAKLTTSQNTGEVVAEIYAGQTQGVLCQPEGAELAAAAAAADTSAITVAQTRFGFETVFAPDGGGGRALSALSALGLPGSAMEARGDRPSMGCTATCRFVLDGRFIPPGPISAPMRDPTGARPD